MNAILREFVFGIPMFCVGSVKIAQKRAFAFVQNRKSKEKWRLALDLFVKIWYYIYNEYGD
jgi:uncharacterized membrane protein HdeD (DUF308 family)